MKLQYRTICIFDRSNIIKPIQKAAHILTSNPINLMCCKHVRPKINLHYIHTSCAYKASSVPRKFSKKDVKVLNLNDFETTEKFVQALSAAEKEHLLKGLQNDYDKTQQGNYWNFLNLIFLVLYILT